jgi:hypothetical protein
VADASGKLAALEWVDCDAGLADRALTVHLLAMRLPVARSCRYSCFDVTRGNAHSLHHSMEP